MIYREGTSQEAGTFGVSTIPHIVIADEDGAKKHEYGGSELVSMHEGGTLANTVCEKASSFK